MAREMVPQGGRSAPHQEAVHAATQALLNEVGRSGITVPMIAERAGVTPSTRSIRRLGRPCALAGRRRRRTPAPDRRSRPTRARSRAI